VTPEDIQEVAHDVLRHRILLGFEAEAAGRGADELIDTLLARIGVP
jgi:MoxR-like ATPase